MRSTTTSPSEPLDIRHNNFGALRLLFAMLVIVGHAPEMIDGNLSREPLYRVFGTLSFSNFGVDAFFIASGYLITQSLLSPANTIQRYCLSRVLRIYPAYIAAFLISIYLVGPFAGGDVSSLLGWGILRQAGRMLLLMQPAVPGAFAGLPIDTLNGPMWSLTQEFRCYIMVLVLFAAGLYARKPIFLAIVAAALIALSFHSFQIIRMSSIFLCGSAFYLFRDRIHYSWPLLTVALVGWAGGMFFAPLAEPATATFGAYVIFFLAFNLRWPWLNRIGSTTDISYGTYLYAWPIANLLIMHDRAISPWVLAPITIVLAAGCGFLSWTLIERPSLRLKNRPVWPIGGSAGALKATSAARRS